MTSNKVIDNLALTVLSLNKFTAAMDAVENALKGAEEAAWNYE
jgi:hypothetical protein